MNPTTLPRIEADEAALQDPVVRQELAELDAALAANPLYTYKPHKMQDAFHRAQVKLKVYFAGNRAGKTTAGCVDDLIQALDEDWVPEHLKPFKRFKPPFRCRIVVPDFGRPFSAIAETIRQWCPPSQLKGGSWETAFQKKEYTLSFENGSLIEVMSYEQDVDKFGGVTRERIHYDEEPDGEKGQQIREECRTRLVRSRGSEVKGDEIFTFTPLNGIGWTFDEFEEEKGPEVAKNVWLDENMIVVRASIKDNPHINREDIAEIMGALPERVRRAREDGEFIHLEGLVYPMFDRDKHVVAKAPKGFPKLLDRFEVIDPGYHTTAILFVGFDKDNRLLVYDELNLSERWAIPENAAQRIKDKRNSDDVGLPSYTLIDPAARITSLTDQDTVEAAYYRAGIKTLHAKNDVEGGVFEVMRRLENRDKEGNPDPLLVVSENCSNLLREITRYRIKTKEDGSFGVVKRDDHFVDCLVEGTLIKTERGDVPIERVKVGERVLTRKGFKPVTDAWMSSSDGQVFRLQTTLGEIVGTAGHRVWTENRGFVRMDCLRYSDTLLVSPRPLNFEASSSDAIQTPSTVQTACTSRRATPTRQRGSDAFTRRFGKLPMDRSRRASIFTTSMGTPSTTTSATLSASLPRSMRPSIGRRSGLNARPKTSWQLLSPPPELGTALQRGKPGIVRIPRSSGQTGNLRPGFARSARAVTRRLIRSLRGFARTTVSLGLAANPGLTTKSGLVRSAETGSGRTSTPRSRLARAHVVRVSPAGRARVFDLTVEDQPEFFANGILVHNCLRYACAARPLAPSPARGPAHPSVRQWDQMGAPPAPTKPAPELAGPLGRFT